MEYQNPQYIGEKTARDSLVSKLARPLISARRIDRRKKKNKMSKRCILLQQNRRHDTRRKRTRTEPYSGSIQWDPPETKQAGSALLKTESAIRSRNLPNLPSMKVSFCFFLHFFSYWDFRVGEIFLVFTLRFSAMSVVTLSFLHRGRKTFATQVSQQIFIKHCAIVEAAGITFFERETLTASSFL